MTGKAKTQGRLAKDCLSAGKTVFWLEVYDFDGRITPSFWVGKVMGAEIGGPYHREIYVVLWKNVLNEKVTTRNYDKEKALPRPMYVATGTSDCKELVNYIRLFVK